MPYLASLTADAGPPSIFTQYPQIYGPWSTMSQELMNGPSPLTQGERELILAYAAGVGGCDFVAIAQAVVAYAWGIARGLVEQLLLDPETAAVDARMKALLAYVRKLTAEPAALSQADADAVFAAGWNEQAFHDAIAITARAAFMQRLVQGFGFTPVSREAAAKHAHKRVERGYVNLYPAFRDRK
jgi:uncharacterized peroxidase-related enzyme